MPGYGYEEIQLGRAQQRLGHEVTIVASNFLHPPGRFYKVLAERFPQRQVEPRTEQVDGVTIVRLDAIEMERRVWLRGMEACLQRLRPDIVHAHNLMQFHSVRAALMRATHRGRFGLVVDDHMLYSVVRADRVGRLVYFAYRHLLGRVVGRNVDQFTGATEESRRYLQRECGIRGEIPIMPLGVDVDLFRPSPARRQQWRERLGVTPAETVVLYTGKLIESKRLEDLAAAVLQLRAAGRPVRLIMAGDADPAYRDAVVASAHQANDPGAMQVLASMPQEELAGLYNAADLAIWPGSESMAVFEALATGLPVIVTDRSAYAGLIGSGAGSTFEAGRARSLADAIEGLLEPARRQAVGERGRVLAERDYSWQRSAERYLSSYMRILEGRHER